MLNPQLKHPLYLQLADQLSADIQAGVYPVGQKVPSVRRMSTLRGVSVSTVSQAYARLEDQGWLSARPQSGYYVCSNRRPEYRRAQLPLSRPEEQPSEVTKSALISNMLAQLSRPSLVNFGAAIPDSSLLPQRQLQRHIQQTSRFQLRQVLEYQFAPGFEGLRQQLAVRMSNAGIHCVSDDIIISNGCAEAITLCLRAATEPGDLVAVESPCYYGFLQLASMMGLKVIEIPTDPETGMSVEALQLALSQWPVRLIALTARFSNPTGALMPTAKQKQLVELAQQYDVGIIEDDIYGEISFAETSAAARKQAQTDGSYSAIKAFDRDGRVMYCSSFSKTLAAGLRVGWCVPGRWYQQVIDQQTFTTFSSSSLSQRVVHSYLENSHYDRHLRQLRRQLASNLPQFVGAIERYFPDETRFSTPKGGYTMWLALPRSVSAERLYYLARERSISVVPGGLFSNSDQFDHCIRLNIAHPWNDQTHRAMQTLGLLVEQLLRHPKQ